MLTSTMSATADSAATAQAVLYTQQHIAALTEQIEAFAACLREEQTARRTVDEMLKRSQGSPRLKAVRLADDGSVRSPTHLRLRQPAPLPDGAQEHLRLPRVSKEKLERLRRISRDKIAEEYLAPGVGRLASQGA